MTISALPTTPTGQMLGLLSELSFTQLVNDALRNYQSTLALSRSPLANSALVTPTLVKDEASPTVAERGHGLRLVLQWAVNQLAPGAPDYPVGDYRPLDDPTWRDPHWWRYNILRHRYLEPLHPDDFVGGGRYTESLLALTGISSADTFFDERNRAIRAVAERLRQQLVDGQASADLQRLALQEAIVPLEKQKEAARLLGIAATFDDIFPRSLIVAMAAQEGLCQPEALLDDLIDQRFLLTGDEGASLWLAPVLRAYVYERQSKPESQRRHRAIADYYTTEDDPLPAARHWQRAGQDARAVRVLLPVAEELIHELQVKELIEFLQPIDARRLVDDQWYAVQLLLSDLYQRSGQHEEALAACRQALQATEEPTKQACVYRRMGKLYESRNQLHALRYYQQAVERFDPNNPELAELLKDRGWLYFYRKEWTKADHDLQQAITLAPPQATTLRADIYDAMASLNRETGKPESALTYAERALAVREETGDLLRIAKSQTNLGLLYGTMGECASAVAAHREALSTYEKIGNQEMVAVAHLNIGVAYFLGGQIAEATKAYQASLTLGQSIGLPLIEIKAHYNLVEALTAAAQGKEAKAHWQSGFALAQRFNFDDQEALFRTLQSTLALPVTADSPVPVKPGSPLTLALPPLDSDEQLIVALVQAEGAITPKRLMDDIAMSRATATRRLTALVEKGVLAVEGKGRGTAYYLATPTPATPVNTGGALDLAALQSALQPSQVELAHRYRITALGVLAQEGSTSFLQLVLSFAILPPLPEYRQLKRRLTELLQREVDLLLEEEITTTTPQLRWLWQAEE